MARQIVEVGEEIAIVGERYIHFAVAEENIMMTRTVDRRFKSGFHEVDGVIEETPVTVVKLSSRGMVLRTGEGNIDSAVRRAEMELEMSTTRQDEELRAIVVEAVKLADDRLEIDRIDPDATILDVWSLDSIMESVRSSIAHKEYELSADAIADGLVGNWDDEDIEYSD